MGGVRRQNDIADILRINRHIQVQGIFHGTHRCQRVCGGTDAADALEDHPRITRIFSFDDFFHSAPHGT